ncbi:MAG: hypothetical protein LDL33_05200 [Desulfomonile sp.]|nr:hypothetical protein [Desulfomonile sp.]
MKKTSEVDIKALRSDILAGLDAPTLAEKYGISETALGKLIVQLIENGDLGHEDLATLYSVSQIVHALTWECPDCHKVVPAAYEECTECGNRRK